jgi:hypothetical protein
MELDHHPRAAMANEQGRVLEGSGIFNVDGVEAKRPRVPSLGRISVIMFWEDPAETSPHVKLLKLG